ncbi:hypothetical protein BMS3Abin04_02642 [bacterium BMS3Abin04]|nr:hypothetical protein BMS3Abin04_02642 [bacterium BMS3Abin04]
MIDEHTKNNHIIDYGTYIFVWLGLIALTSLTVTISGMRFGNYTLFLALLIAAIQATYVAANFMHIKTSEPIFKVFVGVVVFTLIVIFILTFIL